MKISYHRALVTAAALSAVMLLAPLPGLGQVGGPTLTLLDREGKVVRTIAGSLTKPAFSPDWTRVAAIASNRVAGILVRNVIVLDVASGKVTQIASGAVGSLAWSPDGSQLAYEARRGTYFGLYRKAASGEGDEELLHRHPGIPLITDWSSDGRYVGFYAPDLPGGTLYALPLDGAREPLEILRSESSNLLGPFFSPGGGFIAYQSDESGRNEIWVRAFDPGSSRGAMSRTWQISDGGAGRGNAGMMSWRQDGKELYYLAADRGVMAVEVGAAPDFKSERPRLLFQAPPGTVPNGYDETFPTGMLSTLSRDGERFLFAVPPPPRRQQITVFDREGHVLSRVGEPGLYMEAALSPDGSKVAVLRQDPQTGMGMENVWTFDVSTGRGVSVTSDDSPKYSLIWSPDGTHVAYASQRENGYWGVYRRAWNGEGSEELLFRHTPGAVIEGFSFSADGRFLVFRSGGVLLVAPLTGTDPLAREAIELAREEFRMGRPQFSSDSRFLAYLSEESGRLEYYVRPFDASSGTAPAEGKWQITQHGPPLGFLAWRRDGKEILYATGATVAGVVGPKVMAMTVTTTPTFQAGEPRMLFTLPAGASLNAHDDDVQRFVALVPISANVAAPAR